MLEDLIKYKDYENIKYCLILSQTFYKITNESSNSKVFLQAIIAKHHIWKNFEFWEELIKYSVIEEINLQSLGIPNNLEEENDKNNNIVFSQLLSLSYQILIFIKEKDKIKDLILKFIKVYQLPEQFSNQLLKTIEEIQIDVNESIYKQQTQNQKIEEDDDNTGVIEIRNG